jgi:hypothetical protein
MVQQVIQNRRGQDGVAQKLTPFPEAFVAGKHDASTFVSGTDDLKEQVGSQLFRGRTPPHQSRGFVVLQKKPSESPRF